MLNHVSIGVRDLAPSRAFYDAALEPLGYARLSADDASLGYGAETVGFWVYPSARSVAANRDSGLHFCFTARSRKAVDDFHVAALGNGGRDNGAPGLRPDYGPGYYAAYVIDPDGYRLQAYCHEAD